MKPQELRVGNNIMCQCRGEYKPHTIKSIWYNDEEKLYFVELATKHLCKNIQWKDTACIICGYSIEFDCLIAGTHAVANGDKLSDTDVILSVCANYFYVPKDIVKE